MAIQVRFNVWVEVEGEVALSLWRVALLEAVARTGSISAAAAERGVHFRVAWRKIKEMETRLGTRLVVGHTGGAGGGGASLTPQAEALICRFGAFATGLDEEVQRRYRAHLADAPLMSGEEAGSEAADSRAASGPVGNRTR